MNTKSHLESHLFTSDKAVRDRLTLALTSDPHHVVPGSSGEHVRRIQIALGVLCDVQITKSELEASYYGSSTADAVSRFKSKCTPPLLNYKNQIDNIVGKKTTNALDDGMLRAEREYPLPPPPIQSSGFAEVQIGPLGPRREIVEEYYRSCACETIDRSRVHTSPPQTFETLEQLLDLLIHRSWPVQVVVSHGNNQNGLLIPIGADGTFSKECARDFEQIAIAIESGADPYKQEYSADALKSLAFIINSNEGLIFRIANKLCQVRQRRLSIHLRACNIDIRAAQIYKSAFNAQSLSFHRCRLLYLRMRPTQFSDGKTAIDAIKAANLSNARARLFSDPNHYIRDLVVAIPASASSSNIQTWSFVNDLQDIQPWARELLENWVGPSDHFVIPVMWDKNETTFHCPRESGWSNKPVSI